ncbi:MAG: hypothetical protein Q7T76_09525, partial [Ferruginibacter sp.]|nr:hypothetical protein [Ferruginibacter sp.]
MKKYIFTATLFCCTLSIFSQTDDAAKFAATITTTDLKKHLTIIAGDEFEGRETGTEGQRKAAAYIESKFKGIGLQPAPVINGYQQMYPLHKDSMVSSGLKIDGKTLSYGKDYLGSAALNETGEFDGKKLVFAGYGINDTSYNDYQGLDVKGRIVVFFLGEPRKDGIYIANGKKRSSQWSYPGLSRKLAAAKKMGALGAIVINPLQDSFALKSIESSMKTGVNFTSLPTNERGLNFVILSHQWAKVLLGAQFDALVKDAKDMVPMSAAS